MEVECPIQPDLCSWKSTLPDMEVQPSILHTYLHAYKYIYTTHGFIRDFRFGGENSSTQPPLRLKLGALDEHT